MGKQIAIIAARQVLTDPQLPPSAELLKEVLGDNYANFDRLLTLFAQRSVSIEWNYYRDGKSWLAKAQHKKKTVCWVSVWDDCFKLSFFFTHKTRGGINTLPLNASIKADFSAQQTAAKLIPLIVAVRDDSQLSDIEQILEYKIASVR